MLCSMKQGLEYTVYYLISAWHLLYHIVLHKTEKHQLSVNDKVTFKSAIFKTETWKMPCVSISEWLQAVSASISLTVAVITAAAAPTGALLETYMVLTVGPGASQEQNLRALSVTVLTRKVESCISCLETEGGESESERHDLLVFTRVRFLLSHIPFMCFYYRIQVHNIWILWQYPSSDNHASTANCTDTRKRCERRETGESEEQ